MTISIDFSNDGKIALSGIELELLDNLLNVNDRGAFYAVYASIADSDQAINQGQIATFSGLVGGAVLGANRLGQAWFGPDSGRPSTFPEYTGIYRISQQIAEGELGVIKRDLAQPAQRDGVDDGVVDLLAFLESAENVWNATGHRQYFPGNLLAAPAVACTPSTLNGQIGLVA